MLQASSHTCSHELCHRSSFVCCRPYARQQCTASVISHVCTVTACHKPSIHLSLSVCRRTSEVAFEGRQLSFIRVLPTRWRLVVLLRSGNACFITSSFSLLVFFWQRRLSSIICSLITKAEPNLPQWLNARL